MIRSDFTHTKTQNPHAQRSRAILKRYPELRQYMRPYPLSALYIVLITFLQLGIGFYLASIDSGWGWILLSSWIIGAIANHCLFVFTHEACHDLIVKGRKANRTWGIISNLAQGFPSAMAFRNFHLLHHAHMGEYDNDADLAFHKEAKLVGNSWWKKALWFVAFLLIEALRPAKIKKGKVLDKWVIANTVAVVTFNIFIYFVLGPKALAYIILSTFFAVGLHPVGARWIQEHYTYKDGQETFSYYGIMNYLSFNIGYHNEHHDIYKIPWPYIKKLKETAPEFYDDLYYHKSWTLLILDFIFNPERDLFCRIIRGETSGDQETLDTNKKSIVQEAPSLGK